MSTLLYTLAPIFPLLFIYGLIKGHYIIKRHLEKQLMQDHQELLNRLEG